MKKLLIFLKRNLLIVIPIALAVILAVILIIVGVGNKDNKGKNNGNDNPSQESSSSANGVSSTPSATIDEIKDWWENQAQVGQDGSTPVETK